VSFLFFLVVLYSTSCFDRPKPRKQGKPPLGRRSDRKGRARAAQWRVRCKTALQSCGGLTTSLMPPCTSVNVFPFSLCSYSAPPHRFFFCIPSFIPPVAIIFVLELRAQITDLFLHSKGEMKVSLRNDSGATRLRRRMALFLPLLSHLTVLLSARPALPRRARPASTQRCPGGIVQLN